MFDFLKPRWKKEGKLLLKGSKKFLHYKRDLLEDDRIAEIESRRGDLRAAMKAGDRKAVEEAGKQLRATCDKALPRQPQQNWWEENVEVLFVALVVALGIRAYILQPFRIPTGSMQPTLNGIVIEERGEDFEAPWFGQQVWDWLFVGRSYKNIVAERDKQVVALRDASWFLFTRTEIGFSDGSRIKVPSAEGEVVKMTNFRVFEDPSSGRRIGRGRVYRAGEPILRGTITTGDLVLVDKVSYHFRRPDRGETFVFDTRGIPTRGVEASRLAGQTGGQHYIKRLCGVPGDALSIDTPDLLNHGKILDEPGIRRVAGREGAYGKDNRPGYIPARGAASNNHLNAPLDEEGEVLELAAEAPHGLREYAALGDNTENSLDSRYWGTVKEFNLSGPALFSLWPFGSGHWGFID